MKLSIHPDVSIEKIDDRVILINSEETTYRKLNSTGAFIVSQIKASEVEIEVILNIISKKYEIPISLIEKDILNFILHLIENNFLCSDGIIRPSKLIDAKVNGNGLWLQLTNKCNLSCPYCYADSGNKMTPTLNLETIEKVFNDVTEKYFSKIVLTGGEPCLHPQFLEILQLCNGKAMVQVLTNGTIGNRDFIEQLVLNSTMIQISLDGIDAISHEKIKGKGSFKKTLETI